MSRPAEDPTFPPPAPEKTGWPWIAAPVINPPTLPVGASWPRITIVTPLYNQAQYIEATIRSAILQGYPNLEMIVIDDSSTDNGLEVVKRYAAWVRIISRPRGSQNNALNHGFRLATGDLIAWQNSDDLFAPNSLFEGASAALLHPEAAIIHGRTKCFWDHDVSGPYSQEVCEDFSLEAMVNRMCIMNQSMLFRKRVFEDGCFLREEMRYAGDQEFFWRLAIRGYRFQLAPAMIGLYRWHRESITFSPRNIVASDRESFTMMRELFGNRRLPLRVRCLIQSRLRKSFINSFAHCRRNILYKLVPELIKPLRSHS